MNTHQLELAWLGSIFFNPDLARELGLRGIDQSMFKNKEIFEVGLTLMRDADFKGFVPPDSVIKAMMSNRWLSTLTKMLDNGHITPSLYRFYAEEIELRNSKDFE